MPLTQYYPVYCNFLRTVGLLPCEFNALTSEVTICTRSGSKYFFYIFNFVFIISMTLKQLAMLLHTYHLLSTENSDERYLILKIQLLWFMGVFAIGITFVFQAIFLKEWFTFLNSWIRLENTFTGKNFFMYLKAKVHFYNNCLKLVCIF